jgi:hypothetical protein
MKKILLILTTLLFGLNVYSQNTFDNVVFSKLLIKKVNQIRIQNGVDTLSLSLDFGLGYSKKVSTIISEEDSLFHPNIPKSDVKDIINSVRVEYGLINNIDTTRLKYGIGEVCVDVLGFDSYDKFVNQVINSFKSSEQHNEILFNTNSDTEGHTMVMGTYVIDNENNYYVSIDIIDFGYFFYN